MHFLEKLRDADTARNAQWANEAKPFSLIFHVNELLGEVGEACNVLKKLDRQYNYVVKGSTDTIEHLAEELSDVIICSDLVGMAGFLYYNSTCWPVPAFDIAQAGIGGKRDYSELGVMLGAKAGMVGAIALNPQLNNLRLQTAVRDLIHTTKITADSLGIDLEREVITKFNKTSMKLGFDVYL
jgi:NTP pyrophosphatase (non-canonical NTP hydrolase)